MEGFYMNRDSKVDAKGHIKDRNESKKKQGKDSTEQQQKE